MTIEDIIFELPPFHSKKEMKRRERKKMKNTKNCEIYKSYIKWTLWFVGKYYALHKTEK